MVFEGRDSTERSSHQVKQLNFCYLASLLLKWDISIIVHRFERINIIWWLGKEIAFGRASEWKRVEDYQWYRGKEALLWTWRRKYSTKETEKNYLQTPVPLEQGTLNEGAGTNWTCVRPENCAKLLKTAFRPYMLLHFRRHQRVKSPLWKLYRHVVWIQWKGQIKIDF